MRHAFLAPFSAFACLAAAGAVAAPAHCPPGLRPATTAEVFFGEALKGGRQVSDSEWRSFLDGEVTSRFPDGLTVSDVYGQWRGPSRAFVRENAKALFIVLAGAPDEQARLALLRRAYKLRFNQDSVLLVEQNACVSF